MFPDRHDISIEEIPFLRYCEIKDSQEIKYPTKPESNVIYGSIIKGVSASIGSFARAVHKNREFFRRIKILRPKEEKDGHIFLKRRKIYTYDSTTGCYKECYSNAQELERMISSGRGLDLTFMGQDTKSGAERHFYRMIDNNVRLVEAHIPERIISQNLYQFRRTSNRKYSQLRATSAMPKQDVIPQSIQRKSLENLNK
ncbi:MAG: hypothetical protein AABW50_02045 [Nanoarchaeota archaeon]